MRVRYSIFGNDSYSAECDLPEKQARNQFESLKRNPRCLWAELVGEDDGNYMQVLDAFDGNYTLAECVDGFIK